MDGADLTCDNNVLFVVIILLLFLVGILASVLIFGFFGPVVDHSGGVNDYWAEPLQQNMKSDSNDDLAGRGGQQPYGLSGGGGGEVSLDP